jgi:3-oxo-4-pregnene-20-carboxyl-CoA dehydrogenase alpha subunit
VDTSRAVADLTRDVLAKETDAAAAWKALGQAGLLGDGLGVPEMAAVLGEVGRAAAAVPALSTLAFGVLPITRCGTAAQRAELLTGEHVFTAALRGSVSGVDRLSGKVVGVPEAARAHRILVPAADSVYLVDPADTTLTATRSASGSPEYTVEFTDTPATRLGPAGELHRLAVAGACAYGDGLLAGALALTAEHVRTREQFGKPLATFQAVAQQIADVYIASRTLHLAAWAACSLDESDLAVAAYWLTAELVPAMHICHHLHGGLGVDAGYGMHRYYSAAKDLVRLLGGASHRLDEVILCG